jgi:hypothetical protein
VPLAVAVALVMVAGIARIAASEISLGQYVSWSQGLAFAARAWRSLLGAVLGPLVAIWILAAMIALFALLLLRWPGLNVVGALLFPMVMLMAFLAAATALIYVVGVWLIVPAVVCDGADAIDAIQRGYSYVIDRPLRMVLYLALAWIGVVLLVLIAGLFVAAMLFFAGRAADTAVDSRGRGMVWNGVLSAWHSASPTSEYGHDLYNIVPRDRPVTREGVLPESPELPRPASERAAPQMTPGPRIAAERPPAEPPVLAPSAVAPRGSYGLAARIIRFWSVVAALLVPAALLSGLASAATMLYLAMRRACDGQDMSELWWPGKVDEAMEASMAARAKVAGVEAAAAGDLGKADYE